VRHLPGGPAGLAARTLEGPLLRLSTADGAPAGPRPPRGAGAGSPASSASLTQQRLGGLLWDASEVYLRTGTLDAAIATLQTLAQAIDEGVLDLGPRWSALCASRLGDLMRKRGDLGAAEGFYRKALALRERLARDEGDAQAQRDLACSLHRMTGASIATNNAEEAARYLSRLRRVVARLPLTMRAPFEEDIEEFDHAIVALARGEQS